MQQLTIEEALSFLRTEKVQSTVMARFEIIEENGAYVASSNGLTRTMTANEVIEEATMYKVALQRRANLGRNKNV